ncbi:MAG: hypothetical protein PHP01_07775 [Phycisphaerae bacterium]|nr:hypothetical protein [Phycisphaerae bacterium]
MENWFRFSGIKCGGNYFSPVSVEKETDKTIKINGKRGRVNKISSYECYFPTFLSAKSYALDRSNQKILSLELRLSDERAKRDAIMAEEEKDVKEYNR